ncbi:hypothetical protein ACFXQA_12430 [Microbacterium sp. P07]|uniref:hypothetical protein n=1 Tax=Microbacterium sp. P07 TaxID=3366952 RepID=UPI003746DD74
MDTTLTHDAQRTLFQIIHHPTSHNVSWDGLVRLLMQVADVEKIQDGGQIVVRLNEERLTLHRPKGTAVPEQPLLELRRILKDAGIA